MKKIYIILIGILFTSSLTFGQYCLPAYSSGCAAFNDIINNFSTTGGTNNITNNNSGCSVGNYTYYSSMTASRAPLGTVNFNVQAGPIEAQYFGIFVDWNNDQDFIDAGELVWSTTVSTTALLSGSFIVPATAVTGINLRMRVRCQYSPAVTDACASVTWGEAEDYNLLIKSKSSNDAGAEAIVEPIYGCVGVHPVKARIKNFGMNQIFSVVVNWSINGVNQTPFVHSSLLDTAGGIGPNTTIINLGNLTTVNLASYNIAAWTSLPNGVVDTVISNNQANKTIIGSAYPVINLGANTTICPGTSLTLSAGPGLDSAKWSTSATGGSIVVTTAGNYKVTGYKNGCATKDSIVVGLFPPAPTVNIGKDTIICSNSSFVLNANTPGVSYLWQNNTTAPTQTVTTAGIYWVIITDVNGCKKGDTVDVDTLSPPKVLLIAKPGNNLCYGFPYSFEAKPFVKASKMFQWKINGINSGSPTLDSMFSPTLITKDSVSVDMLTDQCTTAVYPVTSNGVVMTIRPSPKLINGIIGNDVVKQNTTKNYGIGADPGHTYLWRVSGGTIIGDSTQTAVQIKWGAANPNASLTLRDKDQTNCTYPNVLPVVITSTIGMESVGRIELRPAYPNPADRTINIPVFSKEESQLQLELYDVTGKKVIDIFNGVVSGERIFTLNVDQLEEGMYFYRINTLDGHESVRKISIQH